MPVLRLPRPNRLPCPLCRPSHGTAATATRPSSLLRRMSTGCSKRGRCAGSPRPGRLLAVSLSPTGCVKRAAGKDYSTIPHTTPPKRPFALRQGVSSVRLIWRETRLARLSKGTDTTSASWPLTTRHARRLCQRWSGTTPIALSRVAPDTACSPAAAAMHSAHMQLQSQSQSQSATRATAACWTSVGPVCTRPTALPMNDYLISTRPPARSTAALHHTNTPPCPSVQPTPAQDPAATSPFA